MWLALSILLCLSVPASSQQIRNDLNTRRQVLEHELRLATSEPNSYYLIIDLVEGQVTLKAGARVLERWPTLTTYQPTETGVSLLSFQQHIEPVTREPGASRGRLGGRLFPLDFKGRLTEGRRTTTRLYFAPAFLIQGDFPSRPDVPGAVLSGRDVKSLASALTPGMSAILIVAPPSKPH